MVKYLPVQCVVYATPLSINVTADKQIHHVSVSLLVRKGLGDGKCA